MYFCSKVSKEQLVYSAVVDLHIMDVQSREKKTRETEPLCTTLAYGEDHIVYCKRTLGSICSFSS